MAAVRDGPSRFPGGERGGLPGWLRDLWRPHVHSLDEEVDEALEGSEEGIRAVKLSLAGLGATAALQLVVALLSGSAALLADTLHNFADAATALPLWLAFALGRRPPDRRYTYGYARAEDLAGLFVLAMIAASAAVAGYESVQKLLQPSPIQHLPWVAAAGLVGFLGNEAVAIYRIRVGERIGSAALVADGYHARVDGLTSLAVFAGAAGVWLGYPLADPIVGLLITIAILKIVWDTGRQVVTRMIDGVEPEVVDQIEHAVAHVPGVREVTNVRVRWLGHRLHAELNLAVDPALSVAQGHAIAADAHHTLLRQLPYLSSATIHVDPANRSGDEHHDRRDH